MDLAQSDRREGGRGGDPEVRQEIFRLIETLVRRGNDKSGQGANFLRDLMAIGAPVERDSGAKTVAAEDIRATLDSLLGPQLADDRRQALLIELRRQCINLFGNLDVLLAHYEIERNRYLAKQESEGLMEAAKEKSACFSGVETIENIEDDQRPCWSPEMPFPHSLKRAIAHQVMRMALEEGWFEIFEPEKLRLSLEGPHEIIAEAVETEAGWMTRVMVSASVRLVPPYSIRIEEKGRNTGAGSPRQASGKMMIHMKPYDSGERVVFPCDLDELLHVDPFFCQGWVLEATQEEVRRALQAVCGNKTEVILDFWPDERGIFTWEDGIRRPTLREDGIRRPTLREARRNERRPTVDLRPDKVQEWRSDDVPIEREREPSEVAEDGRDLFADELRLREVESGLSRWLWENSFQLTDVMRLSLDPALDKREKAAAYYKALSGFPAAETEKGQIFSFVVIEQPLLDALRKIEKKTGKTCVVVLSRRTIQGEVTYKALLINPHIAEGNKLPIKV